MRKSVQLLVALVMGTAVGACFNAPAADVMFACGPDDDAAACPAGYTCEVDGCCHRDGSDVSAQLGGCQLGGGQATGGTGTGAVTSGAGTTTTAAGTSTTAVSTTAVTTTDPSSGGATTDLSSSSSSSGGTDTGTSTGTGTTG